MKQSLAVRFSALITTLVLSACAGSLPRLTEAPVPAPTIAIIRANLWDGTGRGPVPNAVTLIRGDRILCAGAAGECPVPPRARIIDANGQWLIPGLIDSHVHLLFLTRGSASEELSLDLRDLLAQGVTTVRDMGTNPAELLSRVNALNAAPRVYAMQLVAGRRFFFNGFHGIRTARGVVFRQPPAMAMQALGWTPMRFQRGEDADSLVAAARSTGPSRPGDGG
jgi:amidohydrolase family protein